MTKKKWPIVAVIGGILVVLIFISYFYMTSVKSNPKRVSISVVVYGSTAERWTAFKQGVDQAASDLDAVVNFITLSGTNDSQDQQEQMEREIKNGTEGIVVSVADSRKMADYITTTANVIPIVLAENGIYGNESVTCVSANAYEMGKELARQVTEGTADDIPINIVQMEENRSSQKERLAGFRDGCAEAGRTIVQTVYPNRESMSRILESSEEQVLAAVDDLTLEMVVNIISGMEENITLYGIGSSEQIVFAVDRGQIEGIVFQNEFNMGYEAVDVLVQKIRKGGAEEPLEIDFHQATRATLHEPENERLLYPIVQ